MKTNDVFRQNRHIRQFADRQRGCICGNDGLRTGLHRQLAKNFFFDVDLFGGSFDDKLDVAQFHRCGRSDDPGAAFFRFFLSHQAAFHCVGVGFFNVGQTAVDLLPSYIAQNYGDAV